VKTIVDQVKAQVTTYANLSLVPSGATKPFVTSISPRDGHAGVMAGQVVSFCVSFDGTQRWGTEAQHFTGSLDVVGDRLLFMMQPPSLESALQLAPVFTSRTPTNDGPFGPGRAFSFAAHDLSLDF
jgi:hypothetical protein